jgi:phage shock protein A
MPRGYRTGHAVREPNKALEARIEALEATVQQFESALAKLLTAAHHNARTDIERSAAGRRARARNARHAADETFLPQRR